MPPLTSSHEHFGRQCFVCVTRCLAPTVAQRDQGAARISADAPGFLVTTAAAAVALSVARTLHLGGAGLRVSVSRPCIHGQVMALRMLG
jgi:hypothetical protein